jgi:hypothetical protein
MSLLAEERLAKLLLESSELERRVEVTRQVLVENANFDALLCFNTLTQYRLREYFTIHDLEDFLLSQNFRATQHQL